MIHRRIFTICLLALSLSITACATTAAFRQKLFIESSPLYYAMLIRAQADGEGVGSSYPVNLRDAHRITLEILQAHKAIGIIEHPEAGRILATFEDPYPLLSLEPATMSIGVWITAKSEQQTEIVVLSKARKTLAFGRKVVSEKEFHEAFTAALAK